MRPRRRSLPLLALLPLLCAMPVLSAQATASAPKLPAFDVASIRRNTSPTDTFRLMFTPVGVRIHNASLLMIIRASFGMFNSLDDKFIGIPAWAKNEKFDVEARVDPADADAFQKLSFEQRQRLLQTLLADRFKLQTHQELREQPVYLLLPAKGGSRLQPTAPASAEKDAPIAQDIGKIEGRDVDLPQLISALTQALGRTVQDRTGLTGKYDVNLHWSPDEQTADPNAINSGPSLFTALTEQLGLKLESARAPVPCLVIDHVEQPSDN